MSWLGDSIQVTATEAARVAADAQGSSAKEAVEMNELVDRFRRMSHIVPALRALSDGQGLDPVGLTRFHDARVEAAGLKPENGEEEPPGQNIIQVKNAACFESTFFLVDPSSLANGRMVGISVPTAALRDACVSIGYVCLDITHFHANMNMQDVAAIVPRQNVDDPNLNPAGQHSEPDRSSVFGDGSAGSSSSGGGGGGGGEGGGGSTRARLTGFFGLSWPPIGIGGHLGGTNLLAGAGLLGGTPRARTNQGAASASESSATDETSTQLGIPSEMPAIEKKNRSVAEQVVTWMEVSRLAACRCSTCRLFDAYTRRLSERSCYRRQKIFANATLGKKFAD